MDWIVRLGAIGERGRRVGHEDVEAAGKVDAPAEHPGPTRHGPIAALDPAAAVPARAFQSGDLEIAEANDASVEILAAAGRTLGIASIVVAADVEARHIEAGDEVVEVGRREVAARHDRVDLPPSLAYEMFAKRPVLGIGDCEQAHAASHVRIALG